MTPHNTTVLVLAGGDSAERDVSLESARGITAALREAGYRVLVADPARPDIMPTENDSEIFRDTRIGEAPPEIGDDLYTERAEFARVLSAHQSYGIDVVFLGLHGGAGEDGTIQALLEYVGVPHTGSSSAACAFAMDKQRAKILAAAAGVRVIHGVQLAPSALAAGTLEQTVRETVGLPCVVKPNSQGSSVGLTIVHEFAQLDVAAVAAFVTDTHILIEQYIEGREITHAVVEGLDDIPLLEIKAKSGLYDYKSKYQAGGAEYLVPAPIDETTAAAIKESARRTFNALGMSVYGRVDFRLDNNGQHYLLEANSLPGMTATSLVPKMCKSIGVDYVELCDRIVKRSLDRFSG